MVLDEISRSALPVGAYDLIAALTPTTGRRLSPPTMYRSLDYLMRHGLITRIESCHAYVAPRRPGRMPRASLYCICADCGKAVESGEDLVAHRIANAAARAGYVVERCAVEARGLCSACAQGSAGPQSPARPERDHS